MIYCTYCGSNRLIQDDHVIAQSKGGRHTVPACSACNQCKGDKALMLWLRDVKTYDRYRWLRIERWNNGRRNKIAQKVHRVRDERR